MNLKLVIFLEYRYQLQIEVQNCLKSTLKTLQNVCWTMSINNEDIIKNMEVLCLDQAQKITDIIAMQTQQSQQRYIWMFSKLWVPYPDSLQKITGTMSMSTQSLKSCRYYSQIVLKNLQVRSSDSLRKPTSTIPRDSLKNLEVRFLNGLRNPPSIILR